MAKIIERNALNQLAQREMHIPRALTALVIHQEPDRLGAEGESR